ncbi:CHAT domain-containing protein [Flammeovirga aprica]|uniref:CHAT domain-containing protein n=1 Tax=Flammeovirga aprica JL-4 TaxID=694437 RepID=A0A7X9XCL3_9BACT|nr:CHAT domain-containing protein [Flammeovirga aprica]NME71759.1 CHAT domain-containing protein [Flammeovirga aprica JL-4]
MKSILFILFTFLCVYNCQAQIIDTVYTFKGQHQFLSEDFSEVSFSYTLKSKIQLYRPNDENTVCDCKGSYFIKANVLSLEVDDIFLDKDELTFVGTYPIRDISDLKIHPSINITENGNSVQLNFLDLTEVEPKDDAGYYDRCYTVKEKFQKDLSSLLQKNKSHSINVSHFSVTGLPQNTVMRFVSKVHNDRQHSDSEILQKLVNINYYFYNKGLATRSVSRRKELINALEITQSALDAYFLKGHKVGVLMYNYSNGYLYKTLLGARKITVIEKVAIKEEDIDQMVLSTKELIIKNGNNTTRSLVVKKKKSSKHKKQEEAYEQLRDVLFFKNEDLSAFSHLIIIPTQNIGTLPFGAFNMPDGSLFIDHFSYSITTSVSDLINNLADNYNVRRDEEKREIYHMKPFFQELVNKSERLPLSYYTDTLSVSENFKVFIDEYKADMGEISLYRNQYIGGNITTFEQNTTETLLALYNPDFSYSDQLTKLPGTKLEVEAIAKTMEGYVDLKLFEGASANHDHLMNNLLESEILYFATHGIIDPEDPYDGSYLALSQQENGVNRVTGREILDIANVQKINAWLTVMSACDTGLGNSNNWGIMGLARAFQLVGVNQVMMSLWKLDDLYTAKFMSIYFECLKEGGRLYPYSPYKKAIQRFRTEVSNNPYHWASFSIMGIPF